MSIPLVLRESMIKSKESRPLSVVQHQAFRNIMIAPMYSRFPLDESWMGPGVKIRSRELPQSLASGIMSNHCCLPFLLSLLTPNSGFSEHYYNAIVGPFAGLELS